MSSVLKEGRRSQVSIRFRLQEFLDEIDPAESVTPDEVAAVIQAAAPVKLWTLYCGDEESPQELRFYSSPELARQRAEKLAASPGSDVRLEWRRAIEGPGLPVYAGPAPVVGRPQDFPDYEALFQVKPDGTEMIYWQINAVYVNDPENGAQE
jgi:hypothetical protein